MLGLQSLFACKHGCAECATPCCAFRWRRLLGVWQPGVAKLHLVCVRVLCWDCDRVLARCPAAYCAGCATACCAGCAAACCAGVYAGAAQCGVGIM